MALLSVNNQRYTVDLPGDTPLAAATGKRLRSLPLAIA
jgi:hypothetical protein